MNQWIKPSSAVAIIREVLKVRTKGSLAGVNLLMIALVFPVVMFLGSAITWPQMGVIIALFVTWQAFAVYAMMQLPSHDIPQEKPATPESPTDSPKSVKQKQGEVNKR